MHAPGVKNARTALARALVREIRDGDGWPGACCDSLNNGSRKVVAAMAREHGEAWLGDINGRHFEGVTHGKGERQTWIWQWDGALVCNFGAAFVIPRHDEPLEQLLRDRDAAPYTGTREDAARLDVIMARIHEVGGAHLVWS